MKRSTRILSVLLAFLFLFNLILPAAEAIEYDHKGNIVLTPEEAASLLLDKVDALLAEEGDVIYLKELGIPESILKIIGLNISVDYRSIDSALSDVYNLVNTLSTKTFLFKPIIQHLGELKNLDVSPLKNLKRSGGDLNVIYKLVEFLNKSGNKAIILKIVKGQKLDLGLAGEQDLEIDVQGMVLDLIYDELVNPKGQYGTQKRENSAFKSYNADGLLNVALRDLLGSEFDFFTQEMLADVDVNSMSVYSIFRDYLGLFFNSLALEPLNTDFRKALANLSGAKYDSESNTVTMEDEENLFFDKIDWGFEFTEESFAFDANLIAQINDVLYTIFEIVLTDEAFASIDLAEGGNENLNSNIEKLARFILPLCPAEFFHGNFDPAELSEEELDEMSFEKIAALAFRAVIEGSPDVIPSLLESIGLPLDDIEIPEDIQFFPEDVEINTMEELAVYALHGLSKEIVPEYVAGYDASIKAAKTDADLMAVFLDIFMDIVVHYLDEYTPINLPKAQVKTYKARGWGSEEFLDEIIDWVLSLTDGVFTAVDKIPAENRKRGEFDDSFGAWKKLNILINDVLPLNFLNGVSSDDFALDLEKLTKDALLGNLFSLDFAAMLNTFAENDNEGNLLNENIATMLLKVVQGLINSILPNTINDPSTANFTAFLNKNSLGDMVGRLILALNTRKTKLLPALLPIVGSLMFDDLGGVRPALPDAGMLTLELPQVLMKDTGKADFRIISVFSQADALDMFSLPQGVLSGKVSSNISEIGTIVAKKSHMIQKGWDSLDLEKLSLSNEVHVAKSTSIYNDKADESGTGYYYFAAKITDIDHKHFTEDFFAVGYISYEVGGKVETIYTTGNTFTVAGYR